MPKCECTVPWYPDRVNIEQRSEAAGSNIPDYSGAAYKTSVPCRIISTGGDESFRGRQLEAHISHVVEMPWVTGVTATMRLNVVGGIHKDSILNIEYVNKIQAQGNPPTLQIKCTE